MTEHVGTEDNEKKYDVFICHASEDKDLVARPLAEELVSRGLKVWYDEFELRWGDSLRRKIEVGLANSRFGIVVLSPSFFAKEWAQKELDGLTEREVVHGIVVVLPLLHDLSIEELTERAPTLGGKVSLSWSLGLKEVASQAEQRLGRPPSSAGPSVSPTSIPAAELSFARTPTVFPRSSYCLRPERSSEPHLTFRTARIFKPSRPDLRIEPEIRKALDGVLAQSPIRNLPDAKWHRPDSAYQNSLVVVRTVDCDRGATADCWIALPHHPTSSHVIIVVDVNFPGDVRLSLAEACRIWAGTYSTALSVGDQVLPALSDQGLRPVKVELHVDASSPGLSAMIDMNILGETSNEGFVQGIWSRHPATIDEDQILDLIVEVIRSSAIDWGFEDPDPGIDALMVDLRNEVPRPPEVPPKLYWTGEQSASRVKPVGTAGPQIRLTARAKFENSPGGVQRNLKDPRLRQIEADGAPLGMTVGGTVREYSHPGLPPVQGHVGTDVPPGSTGDVECGFVLDAPSDGYDKITANMVLIDQYGREHSCPVVWTFTWESTQNAVTEDAEAGEKERSPKGLDELGRATRELLAQQRSSDELAVGAFLERPTWESTRQMFDTARRLEAIADSIGCRLGTSNRWLFFGTRTRPARMAGYQPGLEIFLDFAKSDASSRLPASVSWAPAEPPEAVMHKVAEGLTRLQRYPGDQQFDASVIFRALGTSVRTALRYRNEGRDIGPMVAIVNRDWALTSKGLESLLDPFVVASDVIAAGDDIGPPPWVGGATNPETVSMFNEAVAFAQQFYLS